MESQSAYKKSLEEVEKAEQKLVDLQEQKNEAARAYNIYLSEKGNSWIASDADLDKEKQLLDRLNQTTQALENQKDRLGDLRASYSAAGETMRGVQEDIDSTKNTISESEEQFGVLVDVMQTGFDVIAKGSEEMANSVEISSEELAEKLETTTSKIEELINAYESKLATRTGTLQSWFEVNATVSGEDATFTALSTALNKQISSFDKWKDDIARLEKEGINENFLDKLKDAGPQSQELVSALLSVTPEQRNKYAGTWNQAYQNAADVAKTQLEGMRKETETQISTMLSEIETLSPEFAAAFGDLANSAVDGYIQKIKERLPELKEWGKAIGSETMEGEKEETDSHSPSRKWAELADNDIDGYVNEFKRRMSDAVSAARKMADDAMNAASRLFGGNIKTDIKGANAAAQAAATTQNAVQTTAAAPTINAGDIAKAVSDSLQELVSGDFTEEITLDSDVLAARTYKKIDILIGRDTTFRTRGYAK
jgi:chromosome segregation ATPase